MQRKEGEKRERRKITVGLFNILQEGLQERVRVGSKGCDPLQWIQAEASQKKGRRGRGKEVQRKMGTARKRAPPLPFREQIKG